MKTLLYTFFFLFLTQEVQLAAKTKELRTCVYAFGMPQLPCGEIAYINGMNRKPDRAIRCALFLSKKAGCYNVCTVYNPTEGLFGDLKKCYHELFRFKCTPPVSMLQARWNSFFAHAKEEETYLQFCHSEGAIQVRNALLRYPTELRKRIIVVAIAPAAYIPDEICHHAYHYVSRRDIIPYFDRGGKKKCEKTIILLTPDDRAPFFDHDFMSPTYREAIEHHLKEYVDTHTVATH